MKITSSGIIKNEDKPRVGVISVHSCADSIYDEIYSGIDLVYEEFLLGLQDKGIEEDSEQGQIEIDNYENDNTNTLFGDWKQIESKYSIDRNGSHGFAAHYHDGIITVEWSKHTKKCHHTSPCYVMADGMWRLRYKG